jgi:hypothetical protein
MAYRVWSLPGTLAFLQRTRVRNMYNVKGSCVRDCVSACCCLPCVLIQDEREVRDREEERRRQAGPATAIESYMAPEGMHYAPQQGRWTADWLVSTYRVGMAKILELAPLSLSLSTLIRTCFPAGIWERRIKVFERAIPLVKHWTFISSGVTYFLPTQLEYSSGFVQTSSRATRFVISTILLLARFQGGE